jgi:hypothetical protein
MIPPTVVSVSYSVFHYRIDEENVFAFMLAQALPGSVHGGIVMSCCKVHEKSRRERSCIATILEQL